MSVVTKSQYRGQARTNTLSGQISLEEGNSRIIGRDQNSIPRLLILADGTHFRMKISPENVDVLTAEGDQLIFDSDNNLFKIVHSDTIDFDTPLVPDSSSDSTSESVDITSFNLTEPPLVLAFITYPSVGSPGDDFTYQFGTGIIQAGIPSGSGIPIIFLVEEEVRSSTTAVTFFQKITNATGFAHPPLNLKLKYFILRETIPQ